MTDKSYGKKLITWHFPEFLQHQRNQGWYAVAGLVALSLLIYSVVVTNFLFAIIIILTAVVLFLRHTTVPTELTFGVYETGVRLGSWFYPFAELTDFSVVYDPPEVELLLINPKSFWQPRLHIPLQGQDPVAVRQLLLDYIDEDLDRTDEPVSHAVERLFKL
ncbi:MAG: hypothetical protein AAB817_02020 [Patescibacteria group bacterium]